MFNNSIDRKDSPINVPKVYLKGEYKGLFWYIGEYVDGQVIVKENNGHFLLLEKYLRRIAKVNAFITDLKLLGKLPLDDDSRDLKNRYQLRLNKQLQWARTDLSDLEKFINNRLVYLKKATIHGDFTPWHLVLTDSNELFLLDAEHARTEGIKFYDFAYFFTRIYIRMKKDNLAISYWKEFKKIYKFKKGDFECLELILAHRLIAAYSEAKQDLRISLEMAEKMRSKLLKQDLL